LLRGLLLMSHRKPLRVLVLCTGNSARSQMAEALFNHLGKDRVVAESAGSRPASRVNPLAIETLEQSGIPWAGHPPRGLDGLEREHWDFVITVCDRAKESCPIFPGQPVMAHWGMPDPAEVEGSDDAKRKAFREAFDLLRQRVELMLAAAPPSVVRRLRALDRFLPAWIFAAMAAGLALGRAFPGLGAVLDHVKVVGVSAPIGVGLIGMMYPVLAKVRYETLGRAAANPRLLTTSLALNWIVGPIVMFVLAWLLLPDLPAYRNGLVIVGLARCIAMVLIWNDLAGGSGELAAVLVALNSLFQILTYSVLGWLFLTVVPGWLGADTSALHVSMWDIAKSVLLFLGVPLLAGYLTRRSLVARRGAAWYDGVFARRIGPLALASLLYTIVLMFAMQGSRIVQLPLDVARIALPLLAYFAVMFGLAFALSAAQGLSYEQTAALSFTAAGNNFELAIAVAIGTFGIASGEALAAVVGPLVEVPALVGLVYVSLWLRRRFFADGARAAG
jgi:ACR3 family arsenite transporter